MPLQKPRSGHVTLIVWTARNNDAWGLEGQGQEYNLRKFCISLVSMETMVVWEDRVTTDYDYG